MPTQRAGRHRRVGVLMKAIMYHYVRPAPEGLPYFRYLHVGDFLRQLDWLAAHHRFVARDELEEACRTGRAPDGVVLTFDDGLSDHYDHVFPILKERGLTGYFYISTFPYESGALLDVHRIHLVLGRLGGPAALQLLKEHLDDAMLSDAHVGEFREATYKNQDNDRATTAFKRTLNYLISYDHRRAVLDRIFAEAIGAERELAARFYLDAGQIREMDAAGMVIGSHGVHHYVFSKLSVADQEREIARSFGHLAGVIGKPVRTFCYPYGGRHAFTDETVACLDRAGASFSFDVNPRDATDADLLCSRQTLPRYDCNMFPHGAASFGPRRPQQAA